MLASECCEINISKLCTSHITFRDCATLLRLSFSNMEFCNLVEGQIFPKEKLYRDSAAWLKELSLVTPQQRLENINKMIKSSDGPRGYVDKRFLYLFFSLMTLILSFYVYL